MTAAPALSPREAEALEGIRRGLSAKAHALELGLSRRTVESHRVRLHEKYGVSSSLELLAGELRRALGTV